MTKQEAIKLENRCDKIVSGYVGEECTVSMALSGKFKVEFNDGCYITWRMTCNEADYVYHIGYHDELVDRIAKIKECINDNRDIFEKLIWSYEHRTELEEDSND
jgi:hypothetical protein